MLKPPPKKVNRTALKPKWFQRMKLLFKSRKDITMHANKPSYDEPIVNGTIKDVHGNEYEVVNGKVGRRIDPIHDRQREIMVDDRPRYAA